MVIASLLLEIVIAEDMAIILNQGQGNKRYNPQSNEW